MYLLIILQKLFLQGFSIIIERIESQYNKKLKNFNFQYNKKDRKSGLKKKSTKNAKNAIKIKKAKFINNFII